MVQSSGHLATERPFKIFMNKSQLHIDKIGWQFDNTYSKLPDNMFTKLGPIPVKKPEVVIINHSLSKEMKLLIIKF